MKPDLFVKMRLLSCMFLLASLSLTVMGQTRDVTGTVVDESGETLPGVSIVIDGTTRGVTTDVNGKFSINASPQDVLVISFVGKKTEKIPVGTMTVINITLKSNLSEIEEVVVIGYGTQRKADVTSAVASVKKEDFLVGNVQDAAELVKGKVAGLTITKGSGDPNAQSVIRLRGIISLLGENTPLVLVDGIEGSIGSVAPESIESIDVLKDASAAAIYGTRGANGVIIITTNKGQRMEETSMIYSAYATLSDFYKTADFMDPHDIRYGLTAFRDGGWDTDWLSAVTQLGYTQNHNFTITGGTEKTSYSTNVGYREERGTIRKTNNKEMNMQFDLSHWFLDDKLKVNFNLIKGTHKNDVTDASNGGVTNIYRQAVIRNPTDPIYVDGDPTKGYEEDFTVFQYYNPVAMIYEHLGEYKSESTRMTGSITLEPVKGWQTEMKLSTRRSNGLTGSYTTKNYFTQETSGYNGYAYKSSSYSQADLLEITSRFNRTINSDHRINAMAGYSYEYNIYESLSASNYGFSTDAYTYDNLAQGTALKDGKASVGSYRGSDLLISFFGRLSYGYQDRFNVLMSLRHEGSSRFGNNNKWATFPSISAGWTISNEEFMRDVSWISHLKLRAGYGVAGMIASQSYGSITKWNYNTTSWGYYLSSDGSWQPTLEVSNNANPDLRWETSGELNIGLEFAVLDDRISGSMEYYVKKTDGLLWWFNVPLPPNLYNETYLNAGKIQNSGLELIVKAIPVMTQDFQYSTTVTITHNANKLISYSSDKYETENYADGGWAGDPVSLPTQRVEEGSSFGRYYTLKTAGLSEEGKWMIQNPATGLYEEYSAAMATVNSPYRQWLGTSGIPKVYLGWGNTFRWKNFDMNIQMSSQLGFQIVNEQRMFYENNYIAYNRLKSAANPIDVVDEYGVPTGESMKLSSSQSQTIVDWFFEDGDFIKIDNLTLGYTFNTLKMRNVNNFRVYMSAENLLCLTKYSGLDPELSNADVFSIGVDGRDKYPTIRSFTVGVSLNFK